MGKRDHNETSGWGAFGAFNRSKDIHGDSTGSFSIFTIIFVLLTLCGIGYYTYLQVYGAVTTGGQRQIGVDLQTGLIGHWTFDGGDTSSTTAFDSSTNNADGTLTNEPSPVIGKLNQALSFDGVNDYVTLSSQTVDGEGTLSAWVKPAGSLGTCNTYGIGGFSVGGSHVAFGFNSCSVGYNNWYSEMRGSYGSLVSVFSTPQTYSTNEELRKWHHVVAVWKDSEGASLYVDGVLASSTTATTGTVDTLTSGSIGQFSGYFPGIIDDFRVYNRRLSAEEVEALYRQGEESKINVIDGPANLETGLVGHWTFDGADMTTATATDVSGNGNDGALKNGPSRVMGKIGQGLSFDGVNDYLEIPPHASHSNLAPLSITGWQYVDSGASFGDDLVTKISSGSVLSFLFRSYWSSPEGRVEFVARFGSQNLTVTAGANSATRGKWQHLAVTWDGTASTSGVVIYVDGQEVSSYQTLTDGSGTRPDDSTYSLFISNNSSNRFQGKVDDIRLYNRVLSADEIAQLYALGGGSKIKICREASVQDADSNVYNTIAIGSQCWLDRNMNVGTRISAATTQTNNGTIEKYCYSNSDANCTGNNPNKPDGGLYQWNEAMQYSTTEGAQGICPAGFHIPTDAEWHTLEKFLTDSGQECSGTVNGYRCANAGLKIQPNGDSRFEGNLSGYYDSDLSSFTSRSSIGTWWSSAVNGDLRGLRYVTSGQSRVYRSFSDQSLALAVRCVQDS